jgi:polysaccharide deacetylase family protein (PEP-CTERM system associated)
MTNTLVRKTQNVFSVDVEDYYQVSAFEKVIPKEDWGAWESRVVANTMKILELLETARVRGTFFILGMVAEQHPHLVRDIHSAGHEIASHGYAHQRIHLQTPEVFREDVRRSKEILESITGEEICAYRAPSFSITKKTGWACRVLVEEGFRYDSSIMPVYHDLYGIPDAPLGIYRIETSAGPLFEFSPPVVEWRKIRVPVGGGGYFRLYPFFWTHRAFRQLNRRQESFIFYIHPWEVDPQQPRVNGASWRSRFRHYLHLKTTEKKISRLLQDFSFEPLRDVLPQASAYENPVTYVMQK